MHKSLDLTITQVIFGAAVGLLKLLSFGTHLCIGRLLEGGLCLIEWFVQYLQFRFIKVLTTIVIMIITLHLF